LTIREFARDPFERVARSPVNENITEVVNKVTSSTYQNGCPEYRASDSIFMTWMPSPMAYGRRTRMKSNPSKYFEEADPIINAKPRITPLIDKNRAIGEKPN